MKTKTSRFSRVKAAVIGAATTGFVASQAHAGVLADAVTDGIDVAELTLIGVAVLAMYGVIALIRGGKKAAN